MVNSRCSHTNFTQPWGRVRQPACLVPQHTLHCGRKALHPLCDWLGGCECGSRQERFISLCLCRRTKRSPPPRISSVASGWRLENVRRRRRRRVVCECSCCCLRRARYRWAHACAPAAVECSPLVSRGSGAAFIPLCRGHEDGSRGCWWWQCLCWQ